MDSAVDNVTNVAHNFVLISIGRNLVEFLIYALRKGEVHTALVLQQTSLHTEEIVALRFLEVGILALEQEFLCFEIIVGVKFIADRHRHKIDFLEALNETLSATKSKHFYETLLCTVVTVFAAAFALGNPNRLFFLC